MWHLLITGLLLGWGAAIPIGPVNLEIMRRNLRFGTRYGMALGGGAASADVTYLLLMAIGALTLLTHPQAVRICSLLGAVILAWFALQAFRSKVESTDGKIIKITKTYSAIRHYFEGYFMTLLNPYTVIFWASVSSQITLIAEQKHAHIISMGVGVILGAVSWMLGLNIVVAKTRHKISPRVMKGFNIFGGVLLLGFAGYTVFHFLR